MPLNLNALERLLFFRLHRGPAPLLDLIAAGSFEAVALAVDLDLFETLAGGDRRVDALAAALDADPAGLRPLLRFLEVEGYVAERGGRYGNTAMTTRWLTDEAGTNVGPFLTFWDELVFPFWEAHLETAVREGAPPRTLYDYCNDEPDRWPVAQRGFRAAATVALEGVVGAVDVPGDASRLLDVGGGHGLYAIELCRQHPGLEATVFDYPDALAVAREEIDAAGLADRVTTRGGDYLADDLGAGYDVALLFNVVHAHDAAANVRLLERVAERLEPGGRVALLDQFEGTSRMTVGRANVRFIGLTYLVTLDARTHPYADVKGWLQEAGFVDVHRTGVLRAGPGNSVVQATWPG